MFLISLVIFLAFYLDLVTDQFENKWQQFQQKCIWRICCRVSLGYGMGSRLYGLIMGGHKVGVEAQLGVCEFWANYRYRNWSN